MSDKISPEHLQRSAYIYVRQSSTHQVRHHQESRIRQYALTERARRLGFAETVMIDEDQGKSGSGLVERPGFGQLLAAVCQGEAGAVLALEASRLARNSRDWHHLIDLCGLTNTLIIDDDGVYDPRAVNDRLLLGLKGTMSEFELNLFRQRARQAFEQKIQRGHAMWELPVGFVRSDEDRVEKIADRQVQEAIAGVFRKFRELGSARQATLWYRDERIPLPWVRPGSVGREILWQSPTAHRLNQILKNPCYAGALAYGRTAMHLIIQEGRARKQAARLKKPREQWKVLILDNHSGYITWNEYLENQAALESNQAMRGRSGSGAAKCGPALLSGLLRCGRCGRKLSVAYGGTGGRVPRYSCCGGRVDRGHAACLSLGGLRIDQAVSRQVLEAIQPTGIEAAISARQCAVHERDEKRKSLELAIEKARYEAARARRQYDAVDPDNRLVAGELEARWNQSLSTVADLEGQMEQLNAHRDELTDEQRQRLRELGHDLPSLWNHPSASPELKKRILRTVLHEIVINEQGDPPHHLLQLHWQGGVHTELQVPRNGPGKTRHITDCNAIELIRELSKVCSDHAIAATLNRLGYHTGAGKTWRVHSVYNARYYYRLPNYRENQDWLTIEAAAKELGVSHTVIRRLIDQKTMPAAQVVPTTPWVIAREHLALPVVQAEIQAVRQGRQLTRIDPSQQQLPFK